MQQKLRDITVADDVAQTTYKVPTIAANVKEWSCRAYQWSGRYLANIVHMSVCSYPDN